MAPATITIKTRSGSTLATVQVDASVSVVGEGEGRMQETTHAWRCRAHKAAFPTRPAEFSGGCAWRIAVACQRAERRRRERATRPRRKKNARAQPHRVRSASTKTPATFSQGTVDDLKAAFAAAKPKFYPSRQRFTLPLAAGQKKATALAAGKKLSDYDIANCSVLTFKDLGPQIGYSTVFFWEYFGPMLTYALVYALPGLVYPWAKKIPAKGPVQNMALAYWTFHYAKRIFETFFVHR